MSDASQAFVHVLLFECRSCAHPLSSAITSSERNVEEVDVGSFAVRCSHCQWSGTLMGTEAKRHWVEIWEPHAAFKH
jgi:hypothetical protein